MNLDFYQTFCHVARHGSISKASESLYITQPAVSRAIKQLEESLGCALFFRTPRGVTLTQEGEILYRHVQQAFGLLEAGEKRVNEVKNLLDGEVRIGVSDTLCKYYLIPYLKLFNTLHPGVKVHVTCPTTPAIIRLLKAGKIDVGMINLPFQDGQLACKNLMEVQDCFVVGEKFKFLSYKVQPLAEIVQYPLLLLEKYSNSRLFLEQYFKANSVSVSPDFELGNTDLLIRFAQNDFGIACVIKNFIQDDLDNERLYEVKPAEKLPSRSIGAVWLREVPLSAAARELISQLEYFEPTEI